MKLLAIQAKMETKDYLSEAAFKEKIFAYCEEAVQSQPEQALIAFPEAIAAPLLFAEDYRVFENSRQKDAVFELLKRNWQAYFQAAAKNKVLAKAVYHHSAIEAFRIYENSFSSAAKEFGAVIVAGSGFFPQMDFEISQGLFVKSRDIFNISNSYIETGRKINSVKKVNLMGLEQNLRLSSANKDQLTPFKVKNQKIGVAICLDAFHESVMSHYDALGTTIVVQPSANFASWTRDWPNDKTIAEGEAWLKYGLREQIQNRENIRLGINPMLVGELFGMELQGRSNIVANQKYFPDANLENQKGLLAISNSVNLEEIVSFDLKS